MLSAAETIVAPAAEPISLDQVKTYLRVDGSLFDEELFLLMVAAREDLELFTGLRFMDQVVRVHADAPIFLDHLTVGPARRLVAIGTMAADGTVVPVDPAGFRLTGRELQRGIAPVGRWPAEFHRSTIVADIAVGYGPDASKVPAALRIALLSMIRGRFDDRPIDMGTLVPGLRINP